jgi:hypothetical protein
MKVIQKGKLFPEIFWESRQLFVTLQPINNIILNRIIKNNILCYTMTNMKKQRNGYLM